MKLVRRIRRAAGPGLAAVMLLMPGCVGYQLGSTLPAGLNRVYVPVFVNETDEPLIENDMTRQVIASIQREGSLKVVPEAEADTVLRVSLRKFIFSPVGFSRDQRTRANEYRLIVSASFVFANARTGQVIVEHPAVEGTSLAPIVGDMTTSKRAAMPEASKRLAYDIVEKIVETWPE